MCRGQIEWVTITHLHMFLSSFLLVSVTAFSGTFLILPLLTHEYSAGKHFRALCRYLTLVNQSKRETTVHRRVCYTFMKSCTRTQINLTRTRQDLKKAEGIQVSIWLAYIYLLIFFSLLQFTLDATQRKLLFPQNVFLLLRW